MKKSPLYLFLFAYCISVIKPVLPFVTDAVAHAFFYQKHIATVHWKNGKSHVHHEFINEAKKENTSKTGSSTKKLMPSDDHLIIVNRSTFLPWIYTQPQLHPNSTNAVSGYYCSDFPPPKLTAGEIFPSSCLEKI